MPSLNWIGKEKIVNHDKDVPFKLLRKNKRYSLGESENLILEGDNLEALKALMPFYYGKIKCIYIDPPYNTGNEKWKYNDNVNSPKIREWIGKTVGTEGDDLCRHDKWLCMMYPRLKLLKELLSEDGVIFISIDDNEYAQLKQVCGEIFDENNLETIIWHKVADDSGRLKITHRIRREHEYILVCYKNKEQVFFKKYLSDRNYKNEYTNPDNDPRGPYKQGIISTTEAKSKSTGKNFYTIKTPSGKEITRQWRFPKEEFERLDKDNRIYYGKDGSSIPSSKVFIGEQKETTPTSLFSDLGTAKTAGFEIENIFGGKFFTYPKPVSLIKHLVKISSDENSIILDSFAGSGTTAHAVLDLNKEDSGNRKFILVEMEKNIAKNITAERVKRVAKGYSYKKNGGEIVKIAGLGGGFEYVELGEPLFDKDGMINKAVSFEDMARYIYFTETKTNLEKKNIKGNCLGEFGGNHYFLLFDGIGKNILNRKFLQEIKKTSGPKIVYADKCLLDEGILEKYQIIFRQIPYQIKIY